MYVATTTMRMLWLLLMMLLRWWRGRWRWQVLPGFINDAQLNDGRRVDWATIGWGGRRDKVRKSVGAPCITENPNPNPWHTPHPKKKKFKKKKKRKRKQKENK
jgi:hypothetical protein